MPLVELGLCVTQLHGLRLLQNQNGYYQWLPAVLGDKCNFLVDVVARAGFDVIRCGLRVFVKIEGGIEV